MDASLNIFPFDPTVLQTLLDPAIACFERSPPYAFQDLPNILGAGLYGLYLQENCGTLYQGLLTPEYPLYIGKAVPTGSRQGRRLSSTTQLRQRLMEHQRSLEQGGLDAGVFRCRWMVLTGRGEELISLLESTLIRRYHPLWNSYIDGFGIHTPGAGRLHQQPSEWDTLHPGRPWLAQLTGAPRNKDAILQKIRSYQRKSVA